MNNIKYFFVISILLLNSFENKNTTKNSENTAISKADNFNVSNIEETILNTGYINSNLYKGVLNETIKITLYITEHENPCGGEATFFNAMYKYDNQDKWILLDITTDRQKKNYCMVENNFTGTLFLNKNKNNFNGYWISPDVTKQYKLELEHQLLDTKFAADDTIIEQLDNILFDDLIFNKNDC